MDKNCLLLTSVNSETLVKVKEICEKKYVPLNYAHTILTFFERYYELMPNIIILDSECDTFLMQETLRQLPTMFLNSIIVANKVNEFKSKFKNLKRVSVVDISEIEQAIDEKVCVVEKGSSYALESYEGLFLNNKVLEELNNLNMKQNLKGYSVLKELILCACVNRYKSLNTMTQMYKIVSRKLNISIICLERNIRTVINDCYNRENSKLKEIFPLRTPTNKQFLIYMVERLHLAAKSFHEKANNNIQYYNDVALNSINN